MSDDPDQPEGVEPEAPDLPDAFVADGRLLVAGFDAQTDIEIDVEALCTIAVAVLSGEGVPQGRIDLHLVDADTITELNVEHMGASGPTDVLSFPLDDDPFALPDDEPSIIGDLVLCPSVAVAQAPEHAGTVDAELALLVIHGVLHLLGHDHAELDETIDMQARERRHLSELGHVHPVPAEPTDPPAP